MLLYLPSIVMEELLELQLMMLAMDIQEMILFLSQYLVQEEMEQVLLQTYKVLEYYIQLK